MVDTPSVLPAGARLLRDEERQALLREMADIVARSHLFKSLDEEGRRRVLTSAYVCQVEAGKDLMQQGDAGSTMYLILNGTVKVTARASGGSVHLAELGRAACVGEVSVLTGKTRTATVTALTDVHCACFEKHRIERILKDYPRVRELLEQLVEGRARDTIEKLVSS